MSSTHTRAEVQEYLDRMRAALADLPDVEISEIMDDAGAHVVEVADELGEAFSTEALTTRLGTPEVYAHELRVAAGYPPAKQAVATVEAKPVFAARFAFWALVAGTAAAFGMGIGGRDGFPLGLLVAVFVVWAIVLLIRKPELIDQVRALPETIAVKSAIEQAEQGPTGKGITYFRSLQPAWWLARAVLIVLAGVIIDGDAIFLVFGLVLAALALASGPRAKKDRRWLWVSLPAAALAAGTLLFILGAVIPNARYGNSYSPSSYVPATPALPSNIYVFDKDGKALTDVYLYDEKGRPLESSFYGCEHDGSDYRDDNRYPKPKVDYDNRGNCREIGGVPFAVSIPTVTSFPQTGPVATTGPVDPSSSVTPPSSVPSAPLTVPTSK
jgi:HAAS domain-containing protein